MDFFAELASILFSRSESDSENVPSTPIDAEQPGNPNGNGGCVVA
jgi:hypothetical protein